MLQKVLLTLAVVAAACSPAQRESEHGMRPARGVISLLGDTLEAVPLPDDLRSMRQRQLDAARAAYEAAPADADSLIWFGRRLAYMGDYQKAIETFTAGIATHPDDARMYRHRGHRYITIRHLDAAIEDLEFAASLVEGQTDEVEPDGLPNALNIPTSTLQSNIWYHLGLARYLVGDFAGASAAYANGIEVSKNDDMLVANSYWYYMSLARLGDDDAARAVLQSINTDMDIIENHSYQRLLLLFKGDLPVDSVLDVSQQNDLALANATVSYGVGQWHALRGHPEQARETWENTIRGRQWAAFGFIAAEAELARETTSSS